VSPRWEKIRFEMDGISDHNDVKFHPVLIGPWTFVKLSQLEGMTFQEAMDRILPRYIEILKEMSARGFEYVQMDEPYLCHDLVRDDLRGVRKVYETLQGGVVR